jgi:hypothetical protein
VAPVRPDARAGDAILVLLRNVLDYLLARLIDPVVFSCGTIVGVFFTVTEKCLDAKRRAEGDATIAEFEASEPSAVRYATFTDKAVYWNTRVTTGVEILGRICLFIHR